MIAEEKFIEWAEVHGKLYGTSRAAIESRLMGGEDVVLTGDACYLRRTLEELHLPTAAYDREQMLASLRHPYIASLIDAGATPDGIPYAVLEQVDSRARLDQINRHLAVSRGNHCPAPSPQMAWDFFDKTKRAAVSARAASLRRSSASSF